MRKYVLGLGVFIPTMFNSDVVIKQPLWLMVFGLLTIVVTGCVGITPRKLLRLHLLPANHSPRYSSGPPPQFGYSEINGYGDIGAYYRDNSQECSTDEVR